MPPSNLQQQVDQADRSSGRESLLLCGGGWITDLSSKVECCGDGFVSLSHCKISTSKSGSEDTGIED